MEYVLFFLALIPIVYFGEVAGLAIYCDNDRNCKSAKPFVWMVPFMQIKLFWECLRLSFKEMGLQPIKQYFEIEGNHIVLLYQLSEYTTT